MRIKIESDGRVFEGTEVQIVQQMQAIAFGKEGRSLGEYIDWLAGQAGRLNGVPLEVAGETDQEKARSLVREMLRTGLASRV